MWIWQVDPTIVLVVPPFVRLKCYQLCDLAIEGTYSARGILSEMQAQGRLYKTATDAAEQLTYIAWQNILALPYASKVTSLAAPVAKFSAMRYNSIVALLKKNKVPLAFLAPLVPIERIEQAAMRSTGALPNWTDATVRGRNRDFSGALSTRSLRFWDRCPDAPARYFVPHLLLHLSILLFSFFGGWRGEQIRGTFVFLTAEAR